jgi:predicted ATPase
MVDALLRGEAVRIEAGRADLAGHASALRPPTSLAGAIAARLGFLSANGMAMLRLAALLGSEFSVTELAAVAGQPARDLLEVADEATAAGVLDASGPRLRFRHALIRQALYEAIPPAVR